MGFGLLFVLLVIGVIAYAAGWRPHFGQWLQPGGPADRDATSDALEILRERYARGEISREDYQRTQQDLRS